MFLYIPMTVRALPVGKPSAHAHFSGFSHDMRRLENPYMDTESPLFQEAERTPGIYLHWSLPSCFTSGTQDPDSGRLSYSLAPDRFSVTRLWTAPDGSLLSKSFLVESDILYTARTPENRDSPSVPLISDDRQPWRFQGRSFPVCSPPADYPGGGDGYVRLTAVSENCPFFAAYAPACQNVFGFLDRVGEDGLSHVTLSYVVCGWYEDHGEPEPCSLIHSPEELEQILGLSMKGDHVPARTLCHGMVEAVQWKTEKDIYPTGTPDDPDPGQVLVPPILGVGNTSAEALAALLAPPGKSREHLLHHYLSSHSRESDRCRGMARAEARLRQSHFHAYPVLSLHGLQNTLEQERDENAVLSSDFPDRLRSLREKQRDLLLDHGEYIQTQRTAYEAWYLYHYTDDPSYRSRFRQQMEDALADAGRQALALAQKQADIRSLEERLGQDPSYPLHQEREDAFYAPADPVVAIIQPAPPDRFPRTPDPLPCRTDGQLLAAFLLEDILPVKKGEPAPVILPSDLALSSPLPSGAEPALEKAVLSCVAEGILLAESFSGCLARIACRKAGLVPTAQELDRITFLIAAAQKARDGHFQGSLPDLRALIRHQASWAPLVVEWEGVYHPDPDLLCKTPSLKNWSLERDDYAFSGDMSRSCSPDNAYPIGGRLFISDTAGQRLTHMIKSLPSSSLLLEEARQMQYLSQALDGFHGRMLMRDASIAMDLFSRNAEERAMLERIRALTPPALEARPVFDGLFSPIRAGFFRLSRIRLIDEMGYYQDVDDPSVYAGEGLLTPGETNPVRYVMLPPRLVQPMMLEAFLLDASRQAPAESLPIPEAAPICGYLVANYLDQGILVYTAGGSHACSIRLTRTGGHILLLNAPGMPPSPVPPPGLDPQLTAFLEGLLALGPKALRDLLALVDRVQFLIQPGTRATHPIDHFGRPIALLRLSMRLLPYGRMEEYRHDPDGGEMDRTHSTDLSSLSVPVRVGCPDNPLDGVYGFFEDGDYRCFHSFPELSGPDGDGYIRYSDQVLLSPARKAPDKILTLLMDPYAQADLITGFLPVKALSIPHGLADRGLDALTVSYFSAPVLCDPALSQVPVPHTDSLSYYWAEASGEDGTDVRPLTPSDPSAAFPREKLLLREGYVVIHEKQKEDPGI